ncbi:hypothetical protein RhiirA5_419349 [Rhizophagus irregularis]|uniref:Uncharacterized protein n=1 Tax=Rhizophagus irregularis TaxID=588596 RepID=A0A2N0PIF1_9GLOM|nr:hypothetical protein RhiirA5_419349 [Rhizophagus irregularis]
MKKYNIEGSWIIIQYFNVVSNPTDNSIVFIGCEGCGLNEKKNLLNQNVYKKRFRYNRIEFNVIKKYILKEKFNDNINIGKILSILKKHVGEEVYVYVDGSIIDSGTDGMAGINFYDRNHLIIDELSEIFAFFITLLVCNSI